MATFWDLIEQYALNDIKRQPRHETPTHKKCTRCGNLVPVREFTANKRAPDGRRSICRGCRAAGEKAARAAKREARNGSS